MRIPVFAIAVVMGSLAVMGSLEGAPAWAQQAPAAPASPAAPAANSTEQKPAEDTAGSEMVCKTFAPPTGTRLGARRVCRTQAEWDRVQTDARTEVQHIQETGLTGRKPGN